MITPGWNSGETERAMKRASAMDLSWSLPGRLRDRSPSDMAHTSALGSLSRRRIGRIPSMTNLTPDETTEFFPARMLNEFTYCPRLFYLEYVQGEWRESADTVEGHARHKRVEKETGNLPLPDEEGATDTIHARSVYLSAERQGLIARLDLLEGEGNCVLPVDYKRGKKPDIPEGAYEPERVQLCVQGLILRENGYRCDDGILYFVGSKERVPVIFDDTLVQRTLVLLNDARSTIRSGTIPSPLIDSPKCPRCSLVGICLPDEIRFLA